MAKNKENPPVPPFAKGGQEGPRPLMGGEIIVHEDTVEAVITNPDDPVETVRVTQRKHKALAFMLNDACGRILNDTKKIKPFEG
jgi:hypothetical protein